MSWRLQHTSQNIVDPRASDDEEPIVIPPQQVGTLLVFKVHQRISALVMKSILSISVLDEVAILELSYIQTLNIG
ncbi:MAG: hypothetical protein R3E08_03120 [Thiotrichaceae bacterium]